MEDKTKLSTLEENTKEVECIQEELNPNTETIVEKSVETKNEEINEEQATIEEEPNKGPTKEEEVKEVVKDVETVEEALNILNDKGFNFNELQREYNELGTLKAETREALNKAGISNKMIDNFTKAQEEKLAKEIEIISTAVGGKEIFKAICEWTQANCDEEEKKTIRGITDIKVMTAYVKDLKNRMEEKEGVLPQYLRGMAGVSSSKIYENKAQMQEDIRNPQYSRDASFRERVRLKIQASIAAGTINL